MPDGVSVSLPAMLRAWRQLGSDSLWVRVQVKGVPDVVMAAVGAAMSAANDAEWEATGGAARVGGSGLSVTPRGPVIFIGFCDSATVLQEWLTRLAANLTDRGLTGKLVAVRSESSAIDNEAAAMTQAAALSVPIDYDQVRRHAELVRGATPGWYAGPDVTAQLVDSLVPWCLYEGGDVFFTHQVMQVQVAPQQAHEMVAAALRKEPVVTLTCVSSRSDFQRITFDLLGRVTLSRTRSGSTWQDGIAGLEQALIDLAPWLDQGLIHSCPVIGGNWMSAVNSYPPLPPYQGTGRGSALREVRHLAARRTHDAYGVQLLTDAHLTHAHDLSGWDVRTVAPGRHLVRARDLAPWYAAEQADPDTLARARADFGNLILTDQIVAEETPQPW